MINRKSYIDIMIKFLDAPVIKILTGMRRIGKSTILIQLKEFLHKKGVAKKNIVYINMELFTNAYLKDPAELHGFVTKKLSFFKGKKYILIDEIQEVHEWERVVQSFLAESLGDIFLTGSNAHMLSSELATLLTGRFIEIPIYGLNFNEFIDFRAQTVKKIDKQKCFNDFIQYGGLPGIHQLPLEESTTTAYLDAVLDTLILRDIVQRHKIRDVSVMERILNFLMDNTGSLVSIKKIADYFKSQGLKVSMDTVSQYLGFLCDASIFTRVHRYNIQGKRQLEYLNKYYLTDIGLRYARMGYSSKRLPGTLETIVFHELQRRGYKVFVGSFGKYEIDFVAQKKDKQIYIQVASFLTEESTIEREFGNLKAIKDNYPKFILSLDNLPNSEQDGIKWHNIRDWLSNG